MVMDSIKNQFDEQSLYVHSVLVRTVLVLNIVYSRYCAVQYTAAWIVITPLYTVRYHTKTSLGSVSSAQSPSADSVTATARKNLAHRRGGQWEGGQKMEVRWRKELNE